LGEAAAEAAALPLGLADAAVPALGLASADVDAAVEGLGAALDGLAGAEACPQPASTSVVQAIVPVTNERLDIFMRHSIQNLSE